MVSSSGAVVDREMVVATEDEFYEGSVQYQAVADVARIFSEKVNAFMRGKLIGSDVPIVLAKSKILAAVGENESPVVIQQGTLGKVLKGKHSDNVSVQLVRQLPKLLDDPVAVFLGRDGRYSFVLGAKDVKQQQTIAVIAPNTRVGRYDLNVIKTVHGKDHFENWIDARQRNDQLVYVDESRSGAYLKESRSKSGTSQEAPLSVASSPSETISPWRPAKGKIITKEQLVNGDRGKLQVRRRENLLNTDFGKPVLSAFKEMGKTQLPVWDRVKSATTKLAMKEQFDRIRITMQDAMLPVFRLQGEIERATGRPVDENVDVYLQETLYTGRVGARAEKLTDTYIEPLLKGLVDDKIAMDDFEAYLYARHAKERNAYIASINPDFAEDEGSGMSDADADAILAAVEVSSNSAAYQRYAAMIDALNAEMLQARVDDGLMSEADAIALRERWEYYVPLRGAEDTLDGSDVGVAERVKTSSGRTVKGKEFKQAFGRKTRAANIVPYVLMQAQEAIIRGEKNRVAVSLYNLAVNNGNDDFWEVNKKVTKPFLNKTTKQVEYRDDPVLVEDADYTVSAKIKGKTVRVVMNKENPSAYRLAVAMRNLNGQDSSLLVRGLSKLTRYLSAINTSYNPEFIFSNALRDLQTGLVTAQQYDVDKLTKKIIKSWLPAIIGAEQGAFKKGESEWRGWFDRYTDAGGRVYFNTTENVQDMRKALEKKIALAKPGIHPEKFLKPIAETVEKLNLGVENGIRVSVFRHLVESGMSEKRAAAAAKELTVNFNRKGQLGPTMNALYMFFNAAVQGTATLATAGYRSAKVRKAMGAFIVSGAFLEVWNQMFAPDDDDGENKYNKTQEYIKSRNFIMYIPGSDRPIQFPAPYGLNMFMHLGRAPVEIALGKKSVLEASSDVLNTAIEAFNPVGGSSSPLEQVAPTVIDPFVEISQNKDFTGRNIRPKEEFTPFLPNSQRKFGSVSDVSDAIATGINRATGGSEFESGLVDMNPEDLDHLLGWVTGSAGRFLGRLADLPAKVMDPASEITTNDIPIVRKLVGNSNFIYVNREWFYERAFAIEKNHQTYKSFSQTGQKKEAMRVASENEALMRLRGLSRQTQNNLGKLRASRLSVAAAQEKGEISMDEYSNRIEDIRDAEKKLIDNFNLSYNKAIAED